MFFFEKDSEAAPKIAISWTPALIAVSRPLELGTKQG